MEPHIHTLTIEGFRAFRKLTIEGLGRVNLITGRNNTGKSSVLEALRLLASGAAPSALCGILRSREEYDAEDNGTSPTGDNAYVQIGGLFHGFPGFLPKDSALKEASPITLVSRGGRWSKKVSLEAERCSRSLGLLTASQQETDGLREMQPLLAITVDGRPSRILPLSPQPGQASLADLARIPDAKDPLLVYEFVTPHCGERTTTLVPLWDRVALSEHEKLVIEALRIIDPRISAVSMVAGSSQRSRRAIVRAEGLPRPVPLRTFGDGLNRLFGIALSLVNAKGGLLLIDEFENGMHHTVQTDIWRAVFRLAKDLDVQVMATSHSWDAVEAFQRAAAETPEEGVLVRLTRKGEDIIPTVFREEELAIVARERIEVR